MLRLTQSPTDPAFVADPYPFYDRMRAGGDLAWWEDYALPCAVSHRAVDALLRDRRLGRQPVQATTPPAHLAPFYRIEDHSMLELEPPRHSRLRGLVLRAFTSRAITAMTPQITALAEELIAAFPRDRPFDLLRQFAQPLPVRVIARMLGVDEAEAPRLLAWSNAMVAMYQARRDRAIEDAAARAAAEFHAFLTDLVEARRRTPGMDLISTLIAAEEDGARLTRDELIATCVLLLNAGHEATVHTIGNGVEALLRAGHRVTEASADAAVEEILRLDPPLHMFTRHVYEDMELFGHRFRRGDQVALLLAAANRDPAVWPDPARFDPGRFDPGRTPARGMAFGAGVHFCIGAPLARLELREALIALFRHCPDLQLAGDPQIADTYHFRGRQAVMLRCA